MKSEELLATRLQAVNTRKGYAASWRIFERWCADSGRVALPTTSVTLGLFLVWALYEQKYKLANVDHIIGAVKDKHRQNGFDTKPLITNEFREARLAAKRDLASKGLQRPSPKKAVTLPMLQACVRGLDDSIPLELRSRAMLLTTFSCGWRRSEIAALALADVEFDDASMIITQHHGKTDQYGKGRQVRIPYAKKHVELCAVTALKNWIAFRGNWDGPLFNPLRGYQNRTLIRKSMDGRAVAELVQRQLEAAGLNPKDYGAHSLRAGMITAAADAGADVVTIMQRTGHLKVETVLKYIRPAQALRADPLANVI